MSLMNGRVRLHHLNGFNLGRMGDAPPIPEEPVVKTEEAIGLIGGLGLLAGSTAVEGEGKLLMALLGLGATLLSGYSVVSRVMSKPEPGAPIQVAPGTPGSYVDPASGKSYLPASRMAPAGSPAQATAGAGLPFRAPQAPQQQISSPQSISALANPFVNPFAKILTTLLAPGPAAPPVRTQGPVSNPYGIVTQEDLIRSTAPSAPIPNLTADYGSLFNTTGPYTPAPIPNIVTSYDSFGGGSSDSSGGFDSSGMVMDLAGLGWYRRTMASVANGA